MVRPEFCSGELYRLGYVVRAGCPERDDWTGWCVKLVEKAADDQWRCLRSDGVVMVVSEERLRASAWLPDG